MPAVAFLILVAVVAGMAYLVVYAVRLERERARERAEQAASRGWTYFSGQHKGVVFTLEGKVDGLSWSLTSLRGGRNSDGHANWNCPGFPSGGGVVHVGSPGIGKFLSTGAGMQIARWGLKLGKAMGGELAGMELLLERGAEVDTGDPEFQNRYSVISTDSALALRLISPAAREALKSWLAEAKGSGAGHRTLSATWGERGLSLSWPRSIHDPAEMVRMAEIGITLVGEAGGGW